MRSISLPALSLAFALSAAPALAGQIVKNGGAVVSGECFLDDSGTPVVATEIVDFYEAKILRGWDLALGEPTEPVEAKIEKMLNRLAVVDPERAEVIRGWYATFDSERAWLRNGASLPQVDDVGEIREVLPLRCFIYQAAGQRIPENLPFDPFYIVDVRWWDKLNNDSKAGLVVHELIYRDGVRRGHTQSVGTRFLTALLATDLIDRGQIGPDVYKGILFRNRFDSYTYNGFRLYPEQSFTNEAAAKEFCANLTVDSQLPYLSGSYLLVDNNNFGHTAFKTSPLGSYLLSLPEDRRVFWTLSGTVKLNIGGFSNSDIYQNAPAPALCYVRL